MGKILCIETSTEVCSVALADNGSIIGFLEDIQGQNHSKLLTVYVKEVLNTLNLKAADLDAVAVSEGPGSYTGLRIGVSVAKGICFATSVPLIAVSPLQAMAYSVISDLKLQGFDLGEDDLFAPMIDARRMEVYTEIFDNKCKRVSAVEAVIIDENSFSSHEDQRIFFFGNGAAKCQNVLTRENFIFIPNIITSTRNMPFLAQAKLDEKQFVDVAYFEPFYLKDFVATIGKRKVI